MRQKPDERSIDELIADIERLKSEIRNRHQLPHPIPIIITPVDVPDFTHLRKMIVDAVTEATGTKIWPKDLKQYVYETAVQSIYGQEFWVWFRSVKWEGQ